MKNGQTRNDEIDPRQNMFRSDSHDGRPGVIDLWYFHDLHKDSNTDRCLLLDIDLNGVPETRVKDLSKEYKEALKKNDSDIHKFAEALALLIDKTVDPERSDKHPVILVGERFGAHIIKHVLLTLARLASQWVEEDTYSKVNLQVLLERVQGIFYYYETIHESCIDRSGVKADPDELPFASRETSASFTRVNVDFQKFRTMRKIKTYALVQGPKSSQSDLTGFENVVPFDVDSYRTASTPKDATALSSFVKSVLGRQR